MRLERWLGVRWRQPAISHGSVYISFCRCRGAVWGCELGNDQIWLWFRAITRAVSWIGWGELAKRKITPCPRLGRSVREPVNCSLFKLMVSLLSFTECPGLPGIWWPSLLQIWIILHIYTGPREPGENKAFYIMLGELWDLNVFVIANGQRCGPG